MEGAGEGRGEGGVDGGAEGVGESSSFEHFQRLAGSSEGFSNLPHQQNVSSTRSLPFPKTAEEAGGWARGGVGAAA